MEIDRNRDRHCHWDRERGKLTGTTTGSEAETKIGTGKSLGQTYRRIELGTGTERDKNRGMDSYWDKDKERDKDIYRFEDRDKNRDNAITGTQIYMNRYMGGDRERQKQRQR